MKLDVVACSIIMEPALAVEVTKRFGTMMGILMEMGLEILVVGREIRAHPTAIRQEKLSLQNRWMQICDLYNPAYVVWVEVTHPEAVPADRYMLINAPATSGTNGLTKSSTSSSDSNPVLDTSRSSGASVKRLHSTVQSSDSAPVPDNFQNSGASAKQAQHINLIKFTLSTVTASKATPTLYHNS